ETARELHRIASPDFQVSPFVDPSGTVQSHASSLPLPTGQRPSAWPDGDASLDFLNIILHFEMLRPKNFCQALARVHGRPLSRSASSLFTSENRSSPSNQPVKTQKGTGQRFHSQRDVPIIRPLFRTMASPVPAGDKNHSDRRDFGQLIGI